LDALGYCDLRGEGSTPVLLPPPNCTSPGVLRASSLANKPSSSSDFSSELRTPDRQSLLFVLRKARFSPKLWTPPIRYGSRNLNVSSYLWASVESGSAASLGQPLREYFAARHLYETAPYSPPGQEKHGTKPERFEILARNFYWLNVTRFYCGCYSRGELSSLAEGLVELANADDYKNTSYSHEHQN
jgi:hypothetical protein